jgi:hypothetical protein
MHDELDRDKTLITNTLYPVSVIFNILILDPWYFHPLTILIAAKTILDLNLHLKIHPG